MRAEVSHRQHRPGGGSCAIAKTAAACSLNVRCRARAVVHVAVRPQGLRIAASVPPLTSGICVGSTTPWRMLAMWATTSPRPNSASRRGVPFVVRHVCSTSSVAARSACSPRHPSGSWRRPPRPRSSFPIRRRATRAKFVSEWLTGVDGELRATEWLVGASRSARPGPSAARTNPGCRVRPSMRRRWRFSSAQVHSTTKKGAP